MHSLILLLEYSLAMLTSLFKDYLGQVVEAFFYYFMPMFDYVEFMKRIMFEFDNIQMSDQPIIIEHNQSTKQEQTKLPSQNPQLFFQLLDQVQNYDTLAQQIKKKHDEAMLLFASIKFNNPFALTPNSHRCLPAFITLDPTLKTQEGYGNFTQTIDDKKYFEQYCEQEQIEKECEQKMKNHLESSNISEQRDFREREILYRFNVLNQQAQVISASNKFHQLLDSLLKSAQLKRQIDTKFKQIETQKRS